MFLDEARILVASGRGGNGIVHFRREKYAPRGGPDGGDGGKGGDVILEVLPTLNTLSSFRHRSHFRAEDGKAGGPSNRTGRSGKDLVIHVPPGTIVREDRSGRVLGDLLRPGEKLVVCIGGRPGRGNARFATPSNRAPRMAEKGSPGEECWLRLELRLLADVGIIGVPNAGKSTLLSAVSNARPKIADYPFTTLSPNLGVAQVDAEAIMILADIPGLIEGAHLGAGLGATFLRHVQRARVLLHLLDGTSPDPLADFSQINSELALFDEKLALKPQVLVLNKIDLPEVQQSQPSIAKAFRELGFDLLAISALQRQNLQPMLNAVYRKLMETEAEPFRQEIPLYRPERDPRAFEISRDPDGAWRVCGKAIERAAEITYWEYEEAVRRFQKILLYLGVEKALRESGVKPGDLVRIGEAELEWQD